MSTHESATNDLRTENVITNGSTNTVTVNTEPNAMLQVNSAIAPRMELSTMVQNNFRPRNANTVQFSGTPEQSFTTNPTYDTEGVPDSAYNQNYQVQPPSQQNFVEPPAQQMYYPNQAPAMNQTWNVPNAPTGQPPMNEPQRYANQQPVLPPLASNAYYSQAPNSSNNYRDSTTGYRSNNSQNFSTTREINDSSGWRIKYDSQSAALTAVKGCMTLEEYGEKVRAFRSLTRMSDGELLTHSPQR